MARERSVSDVCEVLIVSRQVRKHCFCSSCDVCTVPSTDVLIGETYSAGHEDDSCIDHASR